MPTSWEVSLRARIPAGVAVATAVLFLPTVFAGPAGAVSRPTVIGHRGYTGSGCTENTTCAFRAALKRGADAVEMDVRFTRTGYPVIMHDATVNRTTTGSGRVGSKTVAQFTRLRTNDGRHPPTLAQALSAVRAKGGWALVELKTAPSKKQMAHFDAKAAASRLPRSRIIVQSFKSAAVWRAKRDGWRGARLLTYATTASWTWKYHAVGVPYTKITKGGVAKEHRHGVAVYAYTVDKSSAWASLARKGVDAIISNRNPALVKAAVSG